MRTLPAALLALVSLGGCAAESREPPVSLAPTAAGGPPAKAPESANALPLGSQVDAPIIAPEGTINSVRVGPGSTSAPVTSTRPPIAGLGTATESGQPRPIPRAY